MRIVNLLLGHRPDAQPDPDQIMKSHQSEYITLEEMDIFIFTWKAPKHLPKKLQAFPRDVQLIVISIQDLS
jgi:hypothetical protein